MRRGRARVLLAASAAAVAGVALGGSALGCSGCGGGGGGGGAPESGVNNDVMVAETIAICPASAPLSCDGKCVVQDDTHCASCTDVCGAALSCQFGQCTCASDGGTTCSGSCADLALDPRNCGACGHDCMGAPCEAGLCGPTVLANAAMPWGIATDGAKVYFTVDLPGDAGAVMQVPATGGPATAIVEGEPSPQDIVAVGGQVYWTESTAPGWRVMNATASGLGLSPLWTGASGAPIGLASAVNAGTLGLYWGENDADGSYEVWAGTPIGGGHAPIRTPIAGSVGGVASNGPLVLWTLPSNSDNAVIEYDIAAQSSYVLNGVIAPELITADLTSVYVTTAGSPGSVVSLPTAGGTPTLIFSDAGTPQGLAVDTANLYVTTGDGRVTRVPLDGGPPVAIVSGQDNPWQITVDDAAVYWTNYADAGAVMRLAK